MPNNNITLPGTKHFLVEIHSPYKGNFDSQEKMASFEKCLDQMMLDTPLLCWSCGHEVLQESNDKVTLRIFCLLQIDQGPDARIKKCFDSRVLHKELKNRGIIASTIEFIESADRFDEVIAELEHGDLL
jgi:hypothetical protein